MTHIIQYWAGLVHAWCDCGWEQWFQFERKAWPDGWLDFLDWVRDEADGHECRKEESE